MILLLVFLPADMQVVYFIKKKMLLDLAGMLLTDVLN